MYADMLANVVCVSLHYGSHGKGEDPMVSSPMEPVGSRQDPMGHLPFWQGPIAWMSTGGDTKPSSGNRMLYFPWRPYQVGLQATRVAPKEIFGL